MSTGSSIQAIEHSVEKANIWVRDVAAGLDGGDREEAYRALRATLHALRDRLTVEEGAQLSAQFPLLVRGLFYEGWHPSRTPLTYHRADEFLRRVAEDAKLAGETEASYAVAAVAGALRAHVSAGEMADVLSVLPHEIRPLFEPRERVSAEG